MQSFDAPQIETALPFSKIVEVVKTGVLNLERGDYTVPDRLHLEQAGLTYLVMPAMGSEYFCTKLVAVVPENKSRQLPIINGTLILHRADTGQAVAIMDAPMITALRTAAVGTIGLELISKPVISSIGIIGCGLQGTWQTIFATVARPIKQVYCYSRTAKRFEGYQKKVHSYCPNLNLIWCDSAEKVVQQAEAIYTCTTARQPVIPNDAALVKNKGFISVGSFRKDMQELPDAVYTQTDWLVIDAPAARTEVGDVINPLEKEIINESQIIDLGKVLSRKAPLNNHQGIVFKSVGQAAFDLALAEAIFETYSLTTRNL